MDYTQNEFFSRINLVSEYDEMGERLNSLANATNRFVETGNPEEMLQLMDPEHLGCLIRLMHNRQSKNSDWIDDISRTP